MNKWNHPPTQRLLSPSLNVSTVNKPTPTTDSFIHWWCYSRQVKGVGSLGKIRGHAFWSSAACGEPLPEGRGDFHRVAVIKGEFIYHVCFVVLSILHRCQGNRRNKGRKNKNNRYIEIYGYIYIYIHSICLIVMHLLRRHELQGVWEHLKLERTIIHQLCLITI